MKQASSDLQTHASRRRQHCGQRPRWHRPQDDGGGWMHRWHTTLQRKEWGTKSPSCMIKALCQHLNGQMFQSVFYCPS